MQRIPILMRALPRFRQFAMLLGACALLLAIDCGPEPPAPAGSETGKATAQQPQTATTPASLTPSPTRPAQTAMPTPRSTATSAPARIRTTPPSAPPATNTPLPSPSPSPTYATHVVQEEETLLAIAGEYGLNLEAIAKANDLENPNLLSPGQELKIPPATGANVLPALPTRDYGYRIVGFSGQGRAIEAFSFGEGERNLVFVGGVHGGYEWNTVLLAYEMIDYFYGNQAQIPATVTVHIIPVANPDGLYRVTGQAGRFGPAQVVADPPRAARFNGRGVDLNRNWSCDWSASARWGGTNVDPGAEPFSEPETRALRAYFLELQPAAVILWHSQANLVSPGQCGGDAGSAELAEIYAEASGYPPLPFTAYELTGTASDWLNEQGIPAAAVELVDHERTQSGQNLAGMFALFEHYGAPATVAE